MKLFLAALLLVVASAAHADVTGNWVGSLDFTITDDGDVKTDVFNCEFTMAKTNKYILFADMGGCTLMPRRFEIRGSDLYIGEYLVGTISGNNIHISFAEDYTYTMDLTAGDDGKLSVNEVYTEGDNYSEVLAGSMDRESDKVKSIAKIHSKEVRHTKSKLK